MRFARHWLLFTSSSDNMYFLSLSPGRAYPRHYGHTGGGECGPLPSHRVPPQGPPTSLHRRPGCMDYLRLRGAALRNIHELHRPAGKVGN